MKTRTFPRIRLPWPALFAVELLPQLHAERPACFRASDMNSTAFTVAGNEAKMNGIIDGNTPARVRALLTNFPAVDTIVLDNVPGSDVDVSSGGVDFFLAGAVRTIEPDVCEVGVHSWSGGGVTDASTLPRGDRRHLLYLSYYRDIGISEDFYFFTLGAADANDIYNMDDTDIALFGMTGAAFTPTPPAPQVRVGSSASLHASRGNGGLPHDPAGEVAQGEAEREASYTATSDLTPSRRQAATLRISGGEK